MSAFLKKLVSAFLAAALICSAFSVQAEEAGADAPLPEEQSAAQEPKEEPSAEELPAAADSAVQPAEPAPEQEEPAPAPVDAAAAEPASTAPEESAEQAAAPGEQDEDPEEVAEAPADSDPEEQTPAEAGTEELTELQPAEEPAAHEECAEEVSAKQVSACSDTKIELPADAPKDKWSDPAGYPERMVYSSSSWKGFFAFVRDYGFLDDQMYNQICGTMADTYESACGMVNGRAVNAAQKDLVTSDRVQVQPKFYNVYKGGEAGRSIYEFYEDFSISSDYYTAREYGSAEEAAAASTRTMLKSDEPVFTGGLFDTEIQWSDKTYYNQRVLVGTGATNNIYLFRYLNDESTDGKRWVAQLDGTLDLKDCGLIDPDTDETTEVTFNGVTESIELDPGVTTVDLTDDQLLQATGVAGWDSYVKITSQTSSISAKAGKKYRLSEGGTVQGDANTYEAVDFYVPQNTTITFTQTAAEESVR